MRSPSPAICWYAVPNSANWSIGACAATSSCSPAAASPSCAPSKRSIATVSINARISASSATLNSDGTRFVGAFRTEEITAPPAASAALAEDYARCAAITRQSSSNFYYAFMLLPPERRRALYGVYAFCRFIDDIADDDSITEPAAMLARWRDELRNVFAGTPTRAVSRALADNVG